MAIGQIIFARGTHAIATLMLVLLFRAVFNAAIRATMQCVTHTELPLTTLDQMIGKAAIAIEAPKAFVALHRLSCPKRTILRFGRLASHANRNAAMLPLISEAAVAVAAPIIFPEKATRPADDAKVLVQIE